MDINFYAQSGKSSAGTTFSAIIKELHKSNNCVEIRIAAAYATVSGVRALIEAIGNDVSASYWVIGLDDAITQPGALDLITKMKGAQLRVANKGPTGFRFHPKVYQFDLKGASNCSVAIIGSNNLTSAAMEGNSEAFIAASAKSADEKGELKQFWTALWSQGHKPTQTELDSYAALYKKAKKDREKLEKTIRDEQESVNIKEVLKSDNAELDPAFAQVCWIECGYITAMGRELEFKAEQGLFFGLTQKDAAGKYLNFGLSDGNKISMRMKYQGNHMWRLQMNNQVPEVKAGLRPRMDDGSLGRSPYVAVFNRTKTANLFDLRFIKLTSKEFSELKKTSENFGTLGYTPARQYGWC